MSEKEMQLDQDVSIGHHRSSSDSSNSDCAQAPQVQQVDESTHKSPISGDIEKNGALGNPDSQPNTPSAPQSLSPPPNGGLLAWSQVFAGFFSFFNSWGVVNAFGAFQNHYQTDLIPTESPSTIAWIGSIQAFMIVGFSAVLGRLLDGGHLRKILLVGAFMLVFGLMMTSLSTEFYQLLLAQGFCAGIGCSCFFSSGIATVAPYFSTRRATALGIIASGSSLGGVIYPIMVQKLIPQVGFPWATRIIAFMILGLSAFPCLILKSRVPPRKSGPWIDIASLTDWPFVFFTLGVTFAFIGLFVPIFYIESFAVQYNMRPEIAHYVIAILNAGSVLGRLLPNFIADKTGPMNTLIPCVAIAAILTYVWIAVGEGNNAGTIVFAILYGFMSGSLVSIPGSVVARITSNMGLLGTRLGMMFGTASLGLLIGAPVAGAIINRQNGDFLGAQIFGGTAQILGTIFMIVSRMYMTGGKLFEKA